MSDIRAPGGGNLQKGIVVGDTRLTRKPPVPTDRLTGKHAIDAWHSNLGIMWERKTFSAEDFPLLISYCNAIQRVMAIDDEIGSDPLKFVSITASGGEKVHPLITAQNVYISQMQKLGDRLGLTPMARARLLGAGGKDNKNDGDEEFDEF